VGDHFSGPRVYGDPAADIAGLYAFPSPESPGHVVLVLTVFPGAAVTSMFSDAITYRFRIRPVTIAGSACASYRVVGRSRSRPTSSVRLGGCGFSPRPPTRSRGRTS